MRDAVHESVAEGNGHRENRDLNCGTIRAHSHFCQPSQTDRSATWLRRDSARESRQAKLRHEISASFSFTALAMRPVQSSIHHPPLMGLAAVFSVLSVVAVVACRRLLAIPPEGAPLAPDQLRKLSLAAKRCVPRSVPEKHSTIFRYGARYATTRNSVHSPPPTRSVALASRAPFLFWLRTWNCLGAL